MKPCRFIISLVLLLLSTYIFAQEEDIVPEMNAYQVNYRTGDRTKANLPTTYWENGNIKMDYEVVDGERKIRKEYFESGKLKIETEVVRTFVVDTFVSFDPVTFDEAIEIDSGYLDGRYLEYFEHVKDTKKGIRTIGEFVSSRQTGIWIHQAEFSGSIYKAELFDGRIEGEFIEYYPSICTVREVDKLKKKVEGTYILVSEESEVHVVENKTITSYYVVNKKNGNWYYYELDGTVSEKINFDTGKMEGVKRL